jgi:Txe/YoeB family toxin of Txe-Axe toxin-antitoxin module
VRFYAAAWEDYLLWVREEHVVFERINTLI